MIIVTGAAGFVGSNIARRLMDLDYDVIGVDDLSFGDERNIPEGMVFKKIDFRDISENDINSAWVLIHCATSNIIFAQSAYIETFRNNAMKTLELFNRFRGQIVNISTCSVYGNADCFPIREDAEMKCSNAYDLSKRIVELYLKQRGNYTTLRLSNVYGEYQRASNPFCGVIGRLIDCAASGAPFIVYGSGHDRRDYTHVSDVVAAVHASIRKKSLNDEFNIATGKSYSVLDLIDKVEAISGKKIRVEFGSARSIDNIKDRALDIEKANKYLCYIPKTKIEDGILRAWQWYWSDKIQVQ